MGYQFAGFFARPAVHHPKTLRAGTVWREITTPFAGTGVLIPALVGATPDGGEVRALASQLGFHAADSWLYLTYSCWGGRLDFVYGLGSQAGAPFGPDEDSALGTVEATYVGLMGRFGVSAADALRFGPFERGYWDEGFTLRGDRRIASPKAVTPTESVWYEALCAIADSKPPALWKMSNGAGFWWTPARPELGPDRFTSEPFLYAEIVSVTVYESIRIGSHVMGCDWSPLRDRLRRCRGLLVEEQEVATTGVGLGSPSLVLRVAGGAGCGFGT